MPVPTFVITLDPDSETVQSLLSSLRDAGTPARVYPAVDGRQTMPELQDGEALAPRTTLWRHGSVLTPSEVGCYLSHFRLIRQAYEQGLTRVLIMEDDVVLEPSYGRMIGEICALPEDFELIRLMGLKIRKRKVVSQLSDGIHAVVRPERGWLGAQGYLISRPGMAKFLNHGRNIFEAIDKVFDHSYEYDLRSFGIEPHLLMETVHPSSIRKSDRSRTRVPWWLRLAHPIGKGWRSHLRHRYLRRHRSEFYPAEKPVTRPGRSPRLRD